jgi:hypothetical protein
MSIEAKNQRIEEKKSIDQAKNQEEKNIDTNIQTSNQRQAELQVINIKKMEQLLKK